MGKLDDLQIAKAIINEMFKIAGHDVTFDDISGRKDAWYNQYEMTEDNEKDWVDFGIKFLMKQRRWTKKMAETQMAMFNLNYGLRIKRI